MWRFEGASLREIWRNTKHRWAEQIKHFRHIVFKLCLRCLRVGTAVRAAAEPRKAGSHALYGININTAVSHGLPIPSAPRIGCCRRYCLPARPQRLAELQLHLLPAPAPHGGPGRRRLSAPAACLPRRPPLAAVSWRGAGRAPGCPKGRASLPPQPCRHPQARSRHRRSVLRVGLSSGALVHGAASLGRLVGHF